ncbi:MAG: 6-phosphofructokinase [Actinobacteria bacterium]|nr:6-phosphofructokinase [Actinomycetota bacterium]
MRIAVLTSGGDAPGMNGAIRAVTRAGLAQGWEVFGVRNGYAGLLERMFDPLRSRDVGGILHRGGTILGSARAPEFRTEEGQDKGLQGLHDMAIDALIVVGGNGSQTGAHALSERGFPVVGVSSTIDNDLYGTDISIGVDTALNIALESVDRLKTTAASHRRAFLVEVMGRDCGYLALAVGIASGAEAVVIPEVETSPEEVMAHLRSAYARGNDHAVVIVSEGAPCGTKELLAFAEDNREDLDFDLRATILGHVQRGGDPGAFDRLLASRLGAAAVRQLAEGNDGVVVGLQGNEMAATPMPEVVANEKPLSEELQELARLLTR